MSYKYKAILKAAAIAFLDGTLQQDSETGEYLNLGEVEETYSDISIELDHVYAQAAKAKEYEAKAKAFAAICKAHVPLEKRMSPVTIDEGLDFAEKAEEIILKFYEGGGSDE